MSALSSEQQEALATFQAIAGCDGDFAASFLEANGWHLESAVNNFCDPGGMGGGNMGRAGAGDAGESVSNPLGGNPALSGDFGFEDGEPRAKIEQYRDTLIDADPAQRMPSMNSTQQSHPLEAFRDLHGESGAVNGSGARSTRAGNDEPKEVFGLPKRPKNLAEIYAPPTELCFNGAFDDLREAGKRDGKWLLINIQSGGSDRTESAFGALSKNPCTDALMAPWQVAD